MTLFGGVPLFSQDFAASIVFIIAYAAILPLAFFRLLKPETRHRVLFKPILLVAIRITSYSIRASEANGNYGVRVPCASRECDD